jgi:hypothetical protein
MSGSCAISSAICMVYEIVHLSNLSYIKYIDVTRSTANECHIDPNGGHSMYLPVLVGSACSKLLEELLQTRTYHGVRLNERL